MGKFRASKIFTLLLLTTLILSVGIPLIMTTVQTGNQLQTTGNLAMISMLNSAFGIQPVKAKGTPVVNLQVPYIHQCWDTPDDFDGSWACGATSAVMVLAYYGNIAPWPCQCSWPYPHTSNFGNYICRIYTYNGYTFNTMTPDASDNPAYGAYGYIHYSDGLAKLGRMVDYFQKHGFDSWSIMNPSESQVKAELDAGYPVPASTKLTAAGHWVVIKGYTNDGYYIVNDPYGKNSAGGYDGADVLYTWSQMKVNEKWIAIVHPINHNPNPPTMLSQLRSNGVTVIPEGGTTPEDTVIFTGTVSDPDGDQVRLEIELRQISEAFTGVPTQETISEFVPSGTQVTITRYGLVNAGYHWQYRAKDSKGATSAWQEYGTSGNTDFTVSSNTPPELSNGYVEPSSGDTSTSFYYYVTYFDADGDSPSVKQVYIDDTPYTMSWYSGLDSWITYRYGPKNLPSGSHNYYFYFEDGRGGSDRLPDSGTYSGPPVSSPTNQPPTLPDCCVIPSSGDTSTTFSYYVTYRDPDGDTPTTRYVYVDDSPHTMTWISGDYTSGATFEYSTTLSAGSHNYYFYFDDGHGHTVRKPDSGTYPGPTVSSSNQPPTAIIDYITPNPAVQGKDTVTFAGRGTDSDGSVVAYSWRSSIDGQLSTSASFTKPASGLSVGTHTIYFKVQDDDGAWSTEVTAYLTINPAPQPVLSYSPAYHNFGDRYEGATDSTTFEIWNSGGQTLTYSLSESSGWVTVRPTSGSSTGEHDTITVDIDTTGLSEGSHSCDISISSNGGSGTFTVTVNVVPRPAYGVDLSCSDLDRNIAPGENATYTITVKNIGSNRDTINLVCSSSPWTVSLDKTSVTLDPGSSTIVTLTITAPSDAQDGDLTAITVTGTSQGDTGKSDSVTATTTVSKPSAPPQNGDIWKWILLWLILSYLDNSEKTQTLALIGIGSGATIGVAIIAGIAMHLVKRRGIGSGSGGISSGPKKWGVT
nr:C39 family peptidase [Candidatus Freyarchaeota archaeon]